MPNPVISVTRDEVVARARSVVGQGKYKLGAGGRNPAHATPFIHGFCDCSGFVAWCLGIDRYQPKRIAGGDWLETTAVYRDSQDDGGFFARTMVPQTGDVIVYGDREGRQGHIGVVSAVSAGVVTTVTKVIHCASRQTAAGAVQETAPDVFLRHGAITARFRNLA